jgi:lysophospholipase L1-like esterase
MIAMKKSLHQILIPSIIFISLSACAESAKDTVDFSYPDPKRWTEDIQKFLEWDAKNCFPKDAVLFYGSSSIRYWNTAISFPDLPVMNRGFGGSYTAEALYYVKELVIRYQPRVVIIYEGDNDIAGGIPPETVHQDFIKLTTAIHEALPQTHIIYLAVKLCQQRWNQREKVVALNAMNKAYCETKDYMTFVDTAAVLLGSDQLPISEYFLSDQLHLNEQGYARWNALVGPIILKKYSLAMKQEKAVQGK